MTDVVTALDLYATVYQRGKFKSTNAYQTSPVKIKALNPDSITQAKDISLKFDSIKAIVAIGNNNKIAYKLNEWVRTPFGTLKFVPNKNYVPSDQSKPFFFNLLR